LFSGIPGAAGKKGRDGKPGILVEQKSPPGQPVFLII
jgi:hypothetical protein